MYLRQDKIDEILLGFELVTLRTKGETLTTVLPSSIIKVNSFSCPLAKDSADSKQASNLTKSQNKNIGFILTS